MKNADCPCLPSRQLESCHSTHPFRVSYCMDCGGDSLEEVITRQCQETHLELDSHPDEYRKIYPDYDERMASLRDTERIKRFADMVRGNAPRGT